MRHIIEDRGIPASKTRSGKDTLKGCCFLPGTSYAMDLEKLLTDLRHERERVHAAIAAIERLTKVQTGSGSPIKRRGRPLGSKNKPKESAPQR